MTVTTLGIEREISGMDHFQDVMQYCDDNRDVLVNVAQELNRLLQNHGITVNQFINRCQFSRNNKDNVESWLRGESEPKGRKEYLKIVIGMHMSVEEANRFLARVGGYGRLYPKNIEDAACLHILGNGGNYKEYVSLVQRMTYELYNCMFRETRPMLPSDYVAKREKITPTWDNAYYAKINALNHEYREELKKSTRYLRNHLITQQYPAAETCAVMEQLENTQDMVAYVRDNWREIMSANFKLCDMIQQTIQNNAYVNQDKKQVDNMHALMFDSAVEDIIPPSTGGKMNKYYSELTCYGKPMPRNYIILFGLLYGLDKDGINQMLKVAHMDRLCAKRESEAALIAAISNSRQVNRLSDVKEYIADDKAVASAQMKELIELLFTEDDFDAYNLVRPVVKSKPVKKVRPVRRTKS